MERKLRPRLGGFGGGQDGEGRRVGGEARGAAERRHRELKLVRPWRLGQRARERVARVEWREEEGELLGLMRQLGDRSRAWEGDRTPPAAWQAPARHGVRGRIPGPHVSESGVGKMEQMKKHTLTGFLLL